MTALAVGDAVVIARDIASLRGQSGTIGRFGPDGTTAWVVLPPLRLGDDREIPDWGVWCSVSALDRVTRWDTERDPYPKARD